MMWTLWYENGEVYTSGHGEPNGSPGWGVVCVSQPGVEGKDVLWNTDYYLHRTDTGEWSAHNLTGLVDQLTHFAPHIDCFRAGRQMVTPSFKAIVNRATKEARG
jgi:hypothetical protein